MTRIDENTAEEKSVHGESSKKRRRRRAQTAKERPVQGTMVSPSARVAKSRAKHARSAAGRAAKLFDISRSMVERTARLAKIAPPALLERIKRGELTVLDVERMVGINPKLTKWDRLVNAWNQATEGDRSRFISILLGKDGGTEQ
jgi:hypothetical protein